MRLDEPSIKAVLDHTGQRDESLTSGFCFAVLGLRTPDHFSVGSDSHAVQTARIMDAFEPRFWLKPRRHDRRRRPRLFDCLRFSVRHVPRKRPPRSSRPPLPRLNA